MSHLHAPPVSPSQGEIKPLGQEWVSKITNSDSPDVSVMGGDVGVMPAKDAK